MTSRSAVMISMFPLGIACRLHFLCSFPCLVPTVTSTSAPGVYNCVFACVCPRFVCEPCVCDVILLPFSPLRQGASIPVVVIRDVSQSAPAYISYAPPTVSSILSFDPTLTPATTTVTTPFQLLLVPGADGEVTLLGDDFGFSPLLNVTLGSFWYAIGFNPQRPYYVPGNFHNQTALTFNVPEGEGIGWAIFLSVAGQAFPSPIEMAYKVPVITSIISNSSTGGDGVATIFGLNFGASVVPWAIPPVVYLVRDEDSAVFVCNATLTPACGNQILNRSNTELQFVVPPGAGSLLTVHVIIGEQTAALSGFAYVTLPC